MIAKDTLNLLSLHFLISKSFFDIFDFTMNRAVSEIDDNDGEDGLQEQELAKLSRQYRIMEGDRRAYTEEAQNLMRKQRAEIRTLEAENREIQTNLMNTDSPQMKIKDKENTKKLRSLVEANDEYMKQIEEENKKIADYDAQIRKMECQINKSRKSIGGIMGSEHRHVSKKKQIAVLENRLDKAMVNFNRQLSTNTGLRHEIDKLRQARHVFNNLHQKLQRELTETKQEVADVIQQSTQAYEQRDEAQNKMAAIRERSVKERAQHEAEMKDLERMISHDNKLKEFMLIKMNDRIFYKNEEAMKKKRGDGEKSADADKLLITTYEQAFERIREITNNEDIDLIVEDFIKTEDQNFALFNYVNELNSEVECMQEQTTSLKTDIDLYKAQDNDVVSAKSTMLRKLEVKLSQAKDESDTSTRQLTAINKIMQELKDGINIMFRRIGCNPKPIDDMLGSSSGVQDTNCMLYLGLIEQRVNELLAAQEFMKMKEHEEPSSLAAPTETQTEASKPSTQPQINPPTTGDDLESLAESEEEDDDDTRPLTHKELRQRVMKNLSKKELRALNVMSPQMGAQSNKDSKKKKK
ncbi:unnamed protein product [Owenia fusiformis]|uniref:ODAD1 central coiled coil region domain-containing protein n=1 Tax=Owenia fusiformis TaxID=6347 RepID=A0A8S4Q7D0_OWEFU|nr:unnamed protein product [Owenia fusiformis]